MAASATRVRIARATRQLERVAAFYLALGFPLVDRFEKHAGYAGVILGLPGGAQLEITQLDGVLPSRTPDPDDLLVVYFPSTAQVARVRSELERHGHVCVPPANPYWLDKSVTFADPDGWRVVLCDAAAGLEAGMTTSAASVVPPGSSPP